MAMPHAGNLGILIVAVVNCVPICDAPDQLEGLFE
jgi:hypothetical protein